MKVFRGICLSSFNLGTFTQLLNNDSSEPAVRAETGGYGQWLAGEPTAAPSAEQQADFTILWTLPEQVSSAFAKLLQNEPITEADLFRDVDEFCYAVSEISRRAALTIIPTWVVPASSRGLGARDMDCGISGALLKMNRRMCQNLSGMKGIFTFNASRWVECAGRRAFQTKLWYLTKNPFGNEVYNEAVQDIKAALSASVGRSKKLIVVDLDDTLWGGIVGEVGRQGIQLGGHDYLGEAFQDFQRALKALKNRGILLAIASKNDERIAMEAIRLHPEMILKPNDFVGWRINWQDKADNIQDLAKELNLGIDSIVFIDDSKHERERVKAALPEVYVPDWPGDITLYASHLKSLKCFDSLQSSAEDHSRTSQYQEEQLRIQAKGQHTTREEWLAALDLKVSAKIMAEDDLPRVVQLINKTNQMNLTTRRLTEKEFLQWKEQTGAQIWTIRVADRYGDSGLTGVVSAVMEEADNNTVKLVDFILSCRVFGRNIEDVMLHTAIEWAKTQNASQVVATYLPTEKNGVCLDYFKKSGGESKADGCTFVWSVRSKHIFPKHIRVNAD